MTRVNKKISRRREQEIAKDTGGRRHVNSGSLWWQKSDSSDSGFQYEDKFTKRTFFNLSLKALNKIEKEALAVDKLPVLRIGFTDSKGHSINEFAVLRAKDCVIEDTNLYTENYPGKNHVLTFKSLYALYLKSQIIMMQIFLNEQSFIIMPWGNFLEVRFTILDGGVIK